ncbi:MULTISPECIES: ATP-binding protein [unclassified Microcoleus]|uniref:ATP-binding protein n=1 Tax=unclassified Microcoleus TaxID=2642155 RepID=UPI002FD1E565
MPSFKSRGESRKSEPARQWQLNYPEIWPRIFDPFFTRKPADEGSGLGREIVKKSVEKHSGKIEVTSVIGQRTCIVSISIAIKGDRTKNHTNARLNKNATLDRCQISIAVSVSRL